MKKLISGMTALAIFSTMTMGVCALDAQPPEAAPDETTKNTTIEPKGGEPFDVTPNPETAETEVGFTADPAYMVTIPAKVEMVNLHDFFSIFAPDSKDTLAGTADITAEKVFLEPDQHICVTVSSDDGNGFALTHEKKSDYTVPYNVLTYSDTEADVVKVPDGGVCAEFDTSDEQQAETLAFSTETNITVKYAGKYSDTVVFGISVKEAEQS